MAIVRERETETFRTNSGIPVAWFNASREGNSIWPQANPGIMMFVGEALTRTFGSEWQNWTDLNGYNLSSTQLAEQGRILTNLHRRYHVPYAYAPLVDRAQGERPLSNTAIQEIWRRNKYATVENILNYIEVVKKHSVQRGSPVYSEVVDEVGAKIRTIGDIPASSLETIQEFFTNATYQTEVAILKQLFAEGRKAIETREGQNLAR